MSEDKYRCPHEGCPREFFTQAGLDVHLASHEVKVEKPKAEPKEAKPKPKSKPKTESKPEKKPQPKFDYEARKKRMRKKLDAEVGKKYTRGEFLKMLHLSEDAFTSRMKGSSFKVTEVREMENGWYRITAESLGQKVLWREGPVKGTWHVTVPRL